MTPSEERAEYEANWFAAGFLMPSDHFRSSWEHLKGNVNLLSERYAVTPTQIMSRAKSLGLTHD